MLVVTAGCGGQDPAADEADTAEQEEAAAVPAPGADSIEVLDDERSLERRIEDAAVATQVRIALVDARDLRPYNFDPVVVNGRVLLRGDVATQQERSRAEAVAREVGGVREVTNEITAREQPAVAAERPDTADADTSAQEMLAEGEATDTETDAAAADDPSADDAAADDAAEETEAPAQEEETFHTVRSGESLWTISRRHGVSIDQIRRLNNLSGNNLRPGQRLRVK